MGEIIERHLFDAEGYTGYDYYIRVISRGSQIWNWDTKELKDVGDITWDDSALSLVEEGTTGVYPIVFSHDWRTRDDIARADYGRAYADLISEHKSMEDPDRSDFADEQSYENAKPTDAEKAIVAAQEAQKKAVDDKFALIKNLPAGTYDVIVYKVEDSGGVPAHTDNVEKQFEMKYGSIFGF